MKLGFSTLGCPRWPLEEILERGRQYGFDGVGFRGLDGELDLTKVPAFSPARRAETRRQIAAAGLFPSMMLTSGRLMADDATIEDNLRLVEGHVEIASALGSPFVRVFGGQIPGGLSHAAAVRRAAERLRRLADFAAPRGVTVLLETHDDFVDPTLVRRVMEATDHPHAGVLWDVHHPWRIGDWPIADAWQALSRWVRSVDLKDSVTDFSAQLGYRYVKLGEGEVPVREALHLLAADGYEGWLTFEWEKRWHPDIAEPEESFPHFIAFMRRELAAG